ncbi:MAG: hypothetical protein HOH08_06590, partial [Gammaproteobacteria bacterium]|nr:hypothetical protein [Gammaproteobacteria bacterium]
LCDFLEVSIPEEPYPWVNDSVEFKRRILFIKSLKWFPLLVLLISLFYLI